jgi:hypothetical protein
MTVLSTRDLVRMDTDDGLGCVACLYGVSLNLLFGWRLRMSERGTAEIQAKDQIITVGRLRELEGAPATWSACWDADPSRWRCCGRRRAPLGEEAVW